ncbi:hypothetical protein D915_004679 [Fasciola hepatica]|uniref:N-acetyltransferase domain-containing protein n=1 Tax=Fasciola hepatica TaxID=6192 RepID=A0A4E0S1E5_FASHE|nr:hypothetical protein D915_004679 [Fasciola hepatica]
MFYIRVVNSTDYADMYKFTTRLYEHHIGLCHEGLLDEAQFAAIFEQGYLRGLLLIQSEIDPLHDNLHSTVQTGRTIGCMFYHHVVSTMHGQGLYLDHFSILPEFRRRGLGQMMMARLCHICLTSKGTHIKLMFQKGLALEKLYGKWGFVNSTTSRPRLHLFEAYGRSELCRFLDCGEMLENSSTGKLTSNLLIKIILPLDTSTVTHCPKWIALNGASVGSENSFLRTACSPKPQLVVVTDGNLGEASDHKDVPLKPRMCMFTEQICVCSWMGPMVGFSDFMGDTSLLQPELLYNRVRDWSQLDPNLRGAYWEVPFGSDSTEEAGTTSLKGFLNQFEVPDDTEHVGWNISYLDEVGMRQLIALTAFIEMQHTTEHIRTGSENNVP